MEGLLRFDMRLYTFETKRQQKVGAERDGKLVELPYPAMRDLIRAGSTGLSTAKKALKSSDAPTHALNKVKLLAPIPRPGKILCSGLNYKSHVLETQAQHSWPTHGSFPSYPRSSSDSLRRSNIPDSNFRWIGR